MNLGNLPEASFEIPSRLVLHTTILNEHEEMVLAIFAFVPPVVVDVAVESEGADWGEFVTQKFFNFRFIVIETHAVNGVLQTCVLATDAMD